MNFIEGFTLIRKGLTSDMPSQPNQFPFIPPHWSDEEIERLANQDPSSQFLESHPGLEIHERLESLSSVLRLFNKTALSIQRAIDHFHHEAHQNNLLRMSRRFDRRQLEEEIQEAVYLFSACSMTLVDQSRSLSISIQIPGYQDRVKNSFIDNPRHRFVQELRVDLVHIALHEPSWVLTSGIDDVPTTRFVIKTSQLKRLKEYHRRATEFVSQSPGGIDIGELVYHYSFDVNALHLWLHDEVERLAGALLGDYRRSQRFVHALHFRNLWRFLLSQTIILANRDPYAYLDRYLAPVELAEVLALPNRSPSQIDRIIQFIDVEDLCNKDLRELAYKAFGVAGL